MKRIVSFAAALCLLLALSVPALAETPDMEAALTEAAAGVKQTLEIGDDYTDFSGSYNDGLRPGWYMYWTKEGEELSVTCDENGVITEVYRWINNTQRISSYGFDAHFPSVSKAEAEKTANYWLKRLMGEQERARIDAVSASLTTNGYYCFDGTILLNGLESPITFSIRIDGDGLASYSRSDSYTGYVGGVPAAKTGVDKTAASDALAETVAMELYYVTDADGQARLRYVPVGAYTVVDALSGEAVDMDALYASFGATASTGRDGGYGMEMAAADTVAAGEYGLTEVELSAIANYKDVLTQETLDAALRALPGVGLDGFTLSRCSYAMSGDEITASLRYTVEMTEDRLFGFSQAAYEDYSSWNDTLTVTKYITMDAKTGELISLSTSYPIWDEARQTVDDGEGASLFLQSCAPEKLEECALCTLRGVGAGDGITFARVHDGYYFPENYLYVEISPDDGSVEEFRYVWDEEAAFADSRGIVDEAAAIAAYIDALDVTLGYAACPEDIDWSDPIALRYSDWGYTFVESLRLAYYYAGTENNAGVDALTGEPILTADGESFVYDDLGGEGRDRIEALAEAGIGFDGGSFEPERTITQKEAVMLLLQAEGYDVRGWEEEYLRSEAVWYGFIEAAAWSPEASVTGEELLHMMLGASAYGAAAELTGVWAAEYGDSGYAAVASALGMTSDGMSLTEPCTRADAAKMLYSFMSR